MSKNLSTLNRNKPIILCVDDEEQNLLILKNILEDNYEVFVASDSISAIDCAQKLRPDLILLDILLPGTDGYEIAKAIKTIEPIKSTPIIFVTGLDDDIHEEKGFEVGGMDYITKPFNPKIILARIKTQISLVQKDELLEIQFELMNRFATALEHRDEDIGRHIIQISKFAEIIANEINLDEISKESLIKVIPLYDMGKIFLKDEILLKPSRLASEEVHTVMEHAYFGKHIIGEYDAPIIKLASSIAYTHHEHWDGKGYPQGLKGEEIPLEGRIVGLIDVFDSLISDTPYREAWSIDKAFDYLEEQSGKKFDPKLVNTFLSQKESIIDFINQW